MYELAQLNIAALRAPLDSPALSEFVGNLERINALADAAAGFVWRLQTDEGDATSIRHFGDDVIVNLSVWSDIDTLFDFVYHSAHIDIMRRRQAWFTPSREATNVLWWVKAGARPTLGESGAALESLRRHGPSPAGFTFKKRYPPPVDRPSVDRAKGSPQ
ncbi:MAG: DUF3291 domain-containing protein [Gammaproteobacteria bacterium]|nr:DUF3291 domain-containing protein [Gammaproteobacteria bacterium]